MLSLLVLPILVTPSFATVDISSDANSASCNTGTLNTYTGPTSLQAEWEPNTINVSWYNDTAANGATTPSTTNTCSYSGALTVPSAPAKKTGYTFAGWRLRVAPFDLTTLDSTIRATSYEYKAINYGTSSDYNLYTSQTSSGANAAGLNNGEWLANFSYGTIYGRAYCSSRSGDYYDIESAPYWPSGNSATWAATDAQVMVGRGEHCWCQVTGFTPTNGNRQNVASARWIGFYFDSDGGALCNPAYGYPSEQFYECVNQHCEDECAYFCANETKYTESTDHKYTYLPALFGITQ